MIAAVSAGEKRDGRPKSSTSVPAKSADGVLSSTVALGHSSAVSIDKVEAQDARVARAESSDAATEVRGSDGRREGSEGRGDGDIA